MPDPLTTPHQIVRLIGGRWDGYEATVFGDPMPSRIALTGLTYTRLDDPDTGSFLGGYVLEEKPLRIVMFHPDDLNTADVKAACAVYRSEARPNPHCPRGKVFIFDAEALGL